MSEISRFLMEQVELPMVAVTADIEGIGYPIDVNFFEQLRQKLIPERTSVEQKIRMALRKVLDATAAKKFNPASTDQVAELLFETLKLPVLTKTDKGHPATSEPALKKIEKKHNIVPQLLRHRQLTKLIGTYCNGILRDVDPDGRLRVMFNQLGADTGRFSSSSIIQTMPKPEKDEFKMRCGFKAPTGYQIVGADFEQQELRILAQVSGDRDMRQAIADGVDLHGLAAVKVFNLDCKSNEVETKYPAFRNQIKAIQFGIIYGRGPASLAAELNLTIEDAKKLMDEYFAKFPGVKRFADQIHKTLEQQGFVDDIFGRRRYFPDVVPGTKNGKQARSNPKNKLYFQKLNAAKREAQNFVIQGAAATITKLAMLRCHAHISKEHPNIQMILTLHDEIHFLAPDGEVAHLVAELPALMCDLGLVKFGFTVPMKVKVKTGPSWGELTPWKGATDGQ